MVPTRQRAVALRLAHARAQRLAGVRAWPSCDVLPYPAWLERCAGQARHGPLRGLRRLGPSEEWLLWREAAEHACAGTQLLQPAGLADPLQRSAALARDWGLHWRGDPGPEIAVLERARRHLQRRCEAASSYSATDWTLILREPPAWSAPPLFAGFAAPGAALRQRLAGLGAQLLPPATPLPGALLPGNPQAGAGLELRPCRDPHDELHRAALWCRAELERNPQARLLVVVPQLAQRRASVVLALDHGLAGGALFGHAAEPPYVIEGGRSLAEYPPVSVALTLLRLCGAAVDFTPLGALLRSSYLRLGGPAARAALELLLRERNVHQADLAQLQALARHCRQPDAGALQAALASFAQRAGAAATAGAGSADWARRFVSWLEAAGWPGEAALGSEEQQQCVRLRELLGEMAMLAADGAALDHAAAIGLLESLAQRAAFEAASGDVPVTVTDSLADPLARYEGIWVAGLSADHWPAPQRPDPFIPVALQRAAGLPQASPEGQLAIARQALAAWRERADQLVLSWPESDGEVALQPSHLLAPSRRRREPGALLPGTPDPLLAALRGAGALEAMPGERARAWSAGRALPGGTRTLELQSLCPFRALAEQRLGAAPVGEPVPGLDRFERGLMLHRALQLLWSGLGGSAALGAAAADGKLAGRVRVACEAALRERLARRAQPLPAPLRRNELERLDRAIGALLQQELARAGAAEFTVAQLEATLEREIAAVPLRVRVDRLDRLGDGRLVVIDYKGGTAQAFKPLAERPPRPQLLVYALLAAGAPEREVAAAAFVHLNADGVRWRGVAADARLLPALPRRKAPAAPWPDLLRQWDRVIEGLVREFAAGVARVDPQPGACRRCHLAALCRIDAARQPRPEDEEPVDER